MEKPDIAKSIPKYVSLQWLKEGSAWRKFSRCCDMQGFITKGFVCSLVLLYLWQMCNIDSLLSSFLNHPKNTVVEMLIEILGANKCRLASWTLARSMRSIGWKPLATWNASSRWSLPPAVRRHLFYCMNTGEVAFEEVCTTKRLFCGRTTTRTKATDHSTFIVTQSMTILVVLPSKSLDVIITGLNRAFFRSFVLMSHYMRFEIFE